MSVKRIPADQDVRNRAMTELDRHVLLSAGAGAGKTSVLVGRYINCLAEPDVRVSEVVAVTFTEKAAAEMKTRVRRECRKKVMASRAEGDEEATRHWLTHLRDLEHAPISTIHSLCASILREYPLEAGLDPHFAVLVEEESQLLLTQAVHESARASLDDPDNDLMSSLSIIRDYSWAAGQLRFWVNQRELWSAAVEELPPDRETFEKRWWEMLGQVARGEIEERGLVDSIRFLAGLDPEDFPPGDKLTERAPAVVFASREVLDAEKKGAKPILIALSRLALALPSARRGSKAAWTKAGLDVAKVRETLDTAVNGAREIFGKKYENWTVEGEDSAAYHSFAFTRELVRARERYKERKKRLLGFDFTDLLVAVRDLLRAEPVIRKALAGRYHHIMVDEFQDTNDVQKELLWYLAGAEPLEDELRFERVPAKNVKLFIVGDVKQSIYRFRFADVSVFTRTRDEFVTAPGLCSVLELTTNFRSRPELIDEFYNPLFSHPSLMGPIADESPLAHLFRADYTPLTSFREPGCFTDPVTLDVVMVPGGKDDDGNEEIDEDERDAPEPEPSFDMGATRMREAEIIAREIGDMIERKEEVEVKDGDEMVREPIGPRHIALLFRAMGDVPLYEAALRAHGIPYYTLGGRGYYDRQECRDIWCFLRLLSNREDEVALFAVLRSPLAGVTDETLFWLCREKRLRFAALDTWNREEGAVTAQPAEEPLSMIDPEDWRRIGDLTGFVSELRAVMHRLTLSELLEEIITRTGYTASILAGHDGPQKLANVRKLVELTRRFETGTTASSPETFTQYLTQIMEQGEAEPLAPTRGEGEDVVTISTFHRAKGLEWPMVFTPDLGRQPPPDSRSIYWRPGFGFVAPGLSERGEDTCTSVLAIGPMREDREQDEFERVRLLYVASTRARDGLHLSGSVQMTGSGRPWKNRSWVSVLFTGPLDGETCPEFEGEQIESERKILSHAADVVVDEGKNSLPQVNPGRIRIRWWKPEMVEVLEPEEFRVLELPEPWGTILDRLEVDAPRPVELDRALCRIEPRPPVVSEYVTGLVHYLRCPKEYDLAVRQRLPYFTRLRARRRTKASGADWGTLLHRMAERLAHNPDADVESLTRACLRELGPSLAADLDMLKKASTAIGRFRQTEFFSRLAEADEVMTEKEITVKLNGAFVNGAVDLLFREGEGDWTLVDYKTGAVEASKESYLFQLGLYAGMVERIIPEGERLVRAGLFLLERGKFMEIELPGERANAERMARKALEGIAAGRFDPQDGAPCSGCAYRWACDQSVVREA